MITINDKDYEFKYSLRTLFLWEEITGKPFNVETMFDTYILCYCCLIVGSDKPLDFNEFIDAADKDVTIITRFNEFMQKELNTRNIVDKKKVKTEEKNSQ